MDPEDLVNNMKASLWTSLEDDVRVEDSPTEVLEGVHKLSDARKLRKQAELDVQALENRIFLLEKEEERARQRIELTKKRADEIVSMRQQNMRRKKTIQKLARKAKEPEYVRAKPKQRSERSLSSRESRKSTRKDIEESKRREASKYREERKKQFDAISKRRRQDQKAAKKKMLAIKKQREVVQKRQQQEREKLKLKSQREYQQRIEDEKSIALRFETKAQALERKEMEIIKRLRETQERQREAYQKLEKVMVKPSA